MTWRIFRNAFLVSLTVLALSTALFLGIQYNYYERQVFSQLAVESDYIVHGVELSGEDYFRTLKAADRVTWVAADGTVLYDSFADPATMANHLDRQEIASALENGTGESVHFSDTQMEKTLYYAERMADGTVIRVSCTQNTVMAMLLRMLSPILWIALLALLLSAALSYRLAKQILRPINALDLDNPRAGDGYPELGPLIGRLQEQNRTIRRQLSELSQRQREFAAITENMREGFLLVDGKWNILSGNRSARQLLLHGSEAGNLRECGCDNELLGVVESALAGLHSELLTHEEDAAYQILANPVAADGQVSGVVVLVMDVTERQQREDLRREFSANVSHELKTPLTSISGFAELMKEGLVPMEKVKEFSGDIYRESRRLIDLVGDIINLSRLDENTDVFEKEPVALYELADGVLDELRPVAEKKRVTLELTGEPCSVTGVWQILNEMVYNLCDNAIKYNVEGGRVSVHVEKQGGEVRLSVSDTGIGIPYAHQQRVFERFYRVDKSHSREIGGTGLGLSIVKHGAQYLGARLELQSEVGKGSTFTLIF